MKRRKLESSASDGLLLLGMAAVRIKPRWVHNLKADMQVYWEVGWTRQDKTYLLPRPKHRIRYFRQMDRRGHALLQRPGTVLRQLLENILNSILQHGQTKFSKSFLSGNNLLYPDLSKALSSTYPLLGANFLCNDRIADFACSTRRRPEPRPYH